MSQARKLASLTQGLVTGSDLLNKAERLVEQTYSGGHRMQEVALPATTGTITLNLGAGNNFGGQLTGNIVLGNPSTMPVGQSGVIRIVNDAAAARTIAYGAYWKAPGGSMPSLTAVPGATDLFGYYVESSTRITIVKQEDTK